VAGKGALALTARVARRRSGENRGDLELSQLGQKWSGWSNQVKPKSCVSWRCWLLDAGFGMSISNRKHGKERKSTRKHNKTQETFFCDLFGMSWCANHKILKLCGLAKILTGFPIFAR
jgi:hypothetical protein